MVFDKSAPAGGLDIFTKLENGKAQIRFTVYLSLNRMEAALQAKLWQVILKMYDESDGEVATMQLDVKQDAQSGERLEGYASKQSEGQASEMAEGQVERICLQTHTLIIYPHLWKSVEDPCLYRVQAMLLEAGTIKDSLEVVHAVCTMQKIPHRGFFLNDKPFILHAVRYEIVRSAQDRTSVDTVFLKKDLEILRTMGANCICPDFLPQDRSFYETCLKMGFLIWSGSVEGTDELPAFVGGSNTFMEGNNTLMKGNHREDMLFYQRKTDRYYYYMACWSKEKVLYVCRPQRCQNAPDKVSVKVYSNQKKVALYVDGILQEFKESAPVFQFEDVPVGHEAAVISAQAGDCFHSVTL